jgi:uncharacterized protein
VTAVVPRPGEETVQLRAADGSVVPGTWQDPGAQARTGAVVLAHGLQMDRSEGGLFDRLAAELAAAGLASLRIDFRGHGASRVDTVDMTIAGECLDLEAAVDFARARSHAAIGLVGASFGALPAISVSTKHSGVAALVLWYPVLDAVRTFRNAPLPGMRGSFNPEAFASLAATGHLAVGSLRMGRAVFDEMDRLTTITLLRSLELPVLTIHGDADRHVDYATAAREGAPNTRSRFVRVRHAQHGFPSAADADRVVRDTTEWFRTHLAGRGTG